MSTLKGKTVFITGASRGIGLAIGLRAARDGANVVIAAKTTDPHPKLPGTIFTAAKEIEAAGGQALPLQVDIRYEEQVVDAVAKTVERFGGIDVLVNNASAISLTGTLETPMKRFDLMHQINTRGTYLCSQACLPHLLKSKTAHILNISPPLAMEAHWFGPHVAYTMAKFGMSMCVLGMADEFRDRGVAVNALWPKTAIATAAVQNLLGGDDMIRGSRKPEIMGDAAHAILLRPVTQTTGKFLIDEDVLREEGVKDFGSYAMDPKAELFPGLLHLKRAYRILNVFTVPGNRLSGNPLCVFEDGEGLTDAQMQSLARQFNLSETTFVLNPTQPGATARVRIFTPTFEMPFAGHPTLGTAQAVGGLRRIADVTLEMSAGLVSVRSEAGRWTLRTAKVPASHAPEASSADLARMLGLPEGEVGTPLWVNTGVEQLVVPLRNAEAVAKARPNPELLARLGRSLSRAEHMVYVWAEAAPNLIEARFFFLQNGSVVEDPATGSACANLGGYLLATRHALPVHWQVSQGGAIGRPSLLHLTVDADQSVFVGGEVVDLGSGVLEL